MRIRVDTSDLLKLQDVLAAALTFHRSRDTANAALHLAEHVRHSPLTSRLEAEGERLEGILADYLSGQA